jgi:acyl carrier protein
MASETTIAVKIRTALGEYLKRDPVTITAQDHLRDDLGLDSMAVIELLYRIEDVFDIQIPDQDLVDLTKVGDVIVYVEKRLGTAPTVVAKTSSKPKSKKRRSA